MQIVELQQQGLTISTIRKLTGNDRKPIGKHLVQRGGTGVRTTAPRASKLESLNAYSEQR